MQVRLATDIDADAIRAIYNTEVTGSTTTLDLRPRTAAQQLTWLQQHQGAYPAIVAVAGEGDKGEGEVSAGAIAGFGALSRYRERPAYATTVEDSVYVADGWRGAGVGRLLLEALVALARQHGFHAVIARIVGDNEASISLHHRCGFELVGVERQIGRKFGRWLDISVMQILL